MEYIALNSIELPRDIIEELRLYQDCPMILEFKKFIDFREFQGNFIKGGGEGQGDSALVVYKFF